MAFQDLHEGILMEFAERSAFSFDLRDLGARGMGELMGKDLETEGSVVVTNSTTGFNNVRAGMSRKYSEEWQREQAKERRAALNKSRYVSQRDQRIAYQAGYRASKRAELQPSAEAEEIARLQSKIALVRETYAKLGMCRP